MTGGGLLTIAALLGAFSTAPELFGSGLAQRRDIDHLRERFLAGDLVTLERVRGLAADEGARLDVGAHGLLDDLSRLVRCLPLGPIDADAETPRTFAMRALVRFERIRLERLLKDAEHQSTDLVALLGEPPLYQTEAAPQPAATVRWPVEPEERWPHEIADARATRRRCPSRPGALRLADAQVQQREATDRAHAERRALTDLVELADALPAHAAALVTFEYAERAFAAGADFRLPDAWFVRLERGLRSGPAAFRVAGLLRLALIRERDGNVSEAVRLYRALLEDPELSRDQDSRVRVRLVGLLEPEWADVLTVATSAARPRPIDRSVLANAEARALLATHQLEALMTFGRRWLQVPDRNDPFDEQTEALLLRLGVFLDASRAMAWIEEIGPKDRTKRQLRLDELAKIAVDEQRLDLAAAIYDRLRLESVVDQDRVGPRAAADQVRWIGARAAIEFVRGDAAAFGGLLDEIVTLARVEAARPLARHAPHREIARLSQDLIGRLTNEVDADPERKKFAALLFEAAATLAEESTRWRPVLERSLPALRLLAGSYASAATNRATPSARTGSPEETAKSKKKRRPVKQLGEVVVPRLPEKLRAPDHETPAPHITSFLVYERPGGAVVTGAPWRALAEAREQQRARRRN